MKNGRCPKCNSTNVYAARNGLQHDLYTLSKGEVWDGMMPVELTDYVCTDCGYHEAYIVDPTVLEQITLLGKMRKRWLKAMNG